MINTLDSFLDFTVSPTNAISLTPEQIEQSAQISNSSNPSKQWQTYLNALALFGFETWLTQRDSELVLEKEQCTVFNPNNTLSAICQLKINEFKLCLLSQGTLDDENVIIPRTALDLPDYRAHLYVIMSVDEEQEQTSVEGVIRYDQLQEFQRSVNLILQSDGTYEIPLAWFDPDPNHLLLYLRCLELSAIQLPNPSIVVQAETQNSERFAQLTQSVVNVGLWFQGQLDEFSQSLSWMLLPTPELVTSFRSLPTLDIITEELQARGLSIPNTARGASQNLNLAEHSLKLYALAWLSEETTEWSLLLILGTPSEQPLPERLKLEIRDANGILGEQEIEPNSDQSYLYTQVIGEHDEQFIVTISLNSEQYLTLPPFIFHSEQSR